MMKKEVGASALACAVMALAFIYAILGGAEGVVHATITTTVTGWLFPDGAHWNNGIGAVLFPLIGVGLFAGMARLVDAEGNFGVTLILAGLTIGGVLGTLSINASNTNLIPFALIIVPSIDLIIWLWKGGVD